MSKHFLTDEFEYDFNLIGISCHAKDYRVCWAINKVLQINLEKVADIEFTLKNKAISKHSSYVYIDKETEQEYRLISNKSHHGKLIKEQKQTDYFLLLYDFNKEETKHINKKLKSINLILMSFEINVSTLKSKKNLLF